MRISMKFLFIFLTLKLLVIGIINKQTNGSGCHNKSANIKQFILMDFVSVMSPFYFQQRTYIQIFGIY